MASSLTAGCGYRNFDLLPEDDDGPSEDDGGPSEDASATNFRRKISFQNAGKPALSDFPLALTLEGELGIASETLAFYEADGQTRLGHQLEGEGGDGELQVWVGVPNIDGDSNSDHIWMHYGSTMPTPPPDTLWSEYVGVWHLDELNLAPASTIVDSSPHRHNGVVGSQSMLAISEGIFGTAIDFLERKSLVRIDNHPDLDGMSGLTLEVWIRPTELTNFPRFISKAYFADGGYSGSYLLSYNLSSGGALYTQPSTPLSQFVAAQPAPLNEWSYVVVSNEGNQASIYFNGVLSASATLVDSSVPVSAGDLLLGSGERSANFLQNGYQGRLDEIRISRQARSAAWIAAQYSVLSSQGADFIVIGPEEALP